MVYMQRKIILKILQLLPSTILQNTKQNVF